MRAVRDRHVAGVGRAVAAVDHRHAVHLLEVALLDRLLDPLDVEDHRPVLLVGGHLGQRHPFLGVVAGRHRVLAGIVGIDIVEIAVDDHLPGDLHRVAVDGREDGMILLRVVQELAGVGQRDAVLAVAEHIAGARHLLHPQPVHRVLIGQLDDLVALHHVEADPGDAAVGLVVHEQVAAVIGAVGERGVRVVEVAVEIDAAPARQELHASRAAAPRSGSCGSRWSGPSPWRCSG